MDWKVNLGVAVLGMVLLISIAAVLAFLILPLIMRSGVRRRPLRLLYFVAVGLAYILVEIAFIQRFVLFLGHPTYALTVVIFLMLLSSGLGSLASRRWGTSAAWISIAVIVAALAIYVFFLPMLLNALVGWPFIAKLLVSAGVLVPLGFAMGVPFPTGLRLLTGARGSPAPTDHAIEWAWALNAAASVLGSVLAIVIAIQFGLTITLACGAAAYLFAMLLLPTLRASIA